MAAKYYFYVFFTLSEQKIMDAFRLTSIWIEKKWNFFDLWSEKKTSLNDNSF